VEKKWKKDGKNVIKTCKKDGEKMEIFLNDNSVL
jgi:hypothetical protein